MRIIRAFYSCINFAYNKKGRRTGMASLIHSLRLTCPSVAGLTHLGKMQKYLRTKEEIQVEWDESLSDSNLIDTPDGIIPLNSISPEQREAILFDVMGETTQSAASYAQKGKAKSKAKSKLKSWIADDKLPQQVAKLVTSCIESTVFINVNEISAEFNQFELPRKNQKLKQLIKYINSHNALIDKPKTLNSTNFQEILFKIPIKHGVGADVISHRSMMESMKLYLQTYFPEYPIKLMTLHHDERLPTENTGGHVHVFISGQNSLTGEHDLRLSQIKRVNEFLIKRGDGADCLAESGRLYYIESSEVYSYLQQMFYEFINENLFNEKDLNAEFSPESERQSAKRKAMNKEAKLPKHQRPFNFYTRKIQWLQQQISVLNKQYQSITYNISIGEQTLAKLQTENSEIQKQNLDWQQKTSGLHKEYKQLLVKRDDICTDIEKGQEFIHEQASVSDQLDVEVKNKYAEVNKLNQVAAVKHKQVIELDDDISKKQALLARLIEITAQALQPLEQMISKIYMRFQTADSSKGKYYFNMVLEAFNDKLSPLIRDISIDIAKQTQDNALESALKRKNQKLAENKSDSGL
ncbi:hypothetical protein BCU94_18800 [Shewanella sp. 10N.286.52.C2]|nr:hypothetical protein BCU94_18800 [Shewanella sp. 10N.286.52.C2]